MVEDLKWALPRPPRPPPLPTVDGQSGQLDVVSRLLKDRILLLGTDVNDEVANVLVAQLLYLANEDPDKDITLYINSPGGSPVHAGRLYSEINELQNQYPDKPVYAVIEDMGASAAYYIASAADEIYVDQASMVGSIGVITAGFGYDKNRITLSHYSTFVQISGRNHAIEGGT